MVKRFGVSLEENLLKSLDDFVLKNQFPNRSRAIRHFIKTNLVENKWKDNKEVAGAIILVYDHHQRDLQAMSTEVQHKFYKLILSTQHVHLDHNNCIETITVKGNAKDLKELSDRLISLKGMQHGKPVMTGMV
jgi:CopG family nickel-responsive transcriptional regulator